MQPAGQVRQFAKHRDGWRLVPAGSWFCRGGSLSVAVNHGGSRLVAMANGWSRWLTIGPGSSRFVATILMRFVKVVHGAGNHVGITGELPSEASTLEDGLRGGHRRISEPPSSLDQREN
jgi:hypothetical protein